MSERPTKRDSSWTEYHAVHKTERAFQIRKGGGKTWEGRTLSDGRSTLGSGRSKKLYDGLIAVAIDLYGNTWRKT